MTSRGETTVLDTPPATAPATASTVALCLTRCCRCSCACSCSPRDFWNSITSSPFWLPDDPSRDRSCILLLLPLYPPCARSISFAMQQRASARTVVWSDLSQAIAMCLERGEGTRETNPFHTGGWQLECREER
jgi:hypothetical protein